ncbi:MAG: MFS transporter [Candidatus Thermoplasmatota archaeon]
MDTEQGSIPKYVIVILLVMGAFGVMGGGLVAPGLPTIGEAFDAPEEQYGWVLSVYTLAAAISLPFIGYFIDSIGRRKIGIACLLIDGGAGLAIIFAPSFSVLLLLRFLQGIGIAGLVPVAMTVIGDLFSGERRLKIMGYLTGTISLGAVVIPTLGGALASIDWRLIFAIYGFSLALALFFFFTLPETSPYEDSENTEHNSPLDYVSSLFSVLKIGKIRNMMIHSLILYFLLYALVTFIPIYLVIQHGFAEIFTGLALSIQGVFAFILASRASFVARYIGWRGRAALGFNLMAVGFILLPIWSTGSYLISFSFIIYGIGMGFTSPTIYDRVTRISPKEVTGSVISIFNTMKYVGMTLSPFLLGLALIFVGLNTVFIGVGLMAALWAIFTIFPEFM